MDIPTIPGAVYTISSASSCDVTDKASGQLLGTATSGAPFTTPAYSDALTLSDPDALYVQLKNFNYALAALGLLGGGSTNTLPEGYIAAEFLENHSPVAVRVPVDKPLVGYSFEQSQAYASDETGGEDAEISSSYARIQIASWNKANLFVWVLRSQAGGEYRPDTKKTMRIDIAASGAKIYLDNAFLFEQPGEISGAVKVFNLFSRNSASCFAGKKYWVKMKHNGEMFRDLVPCINPDGKPAFFDRVSKNYYAASNTESYIAGLTRAQARNLEKLPATGGSLTISLPEGYETDEGVATALETARSNGWTLTIQTYTPETATAVARTFAFRRIWVRRTQNENGAYVDTSGTRWMVEWCVDMLTPDGSTPDAHGYELFRSTDAAVAYWELAPWIDPEAEQMMENELLTE